jgi:GxxExxY protein
MDNASSHDWELTGRIIGCAMRVHRVLGPGYVEAIYARALRHECVKAGLAVERERPIAVFYDGFSVGEFVADLVAEDRVIVEVKAVQTLVPMHEVQLVNYLTATGLDIGLLLNFGAASLQIKKKFRCARQD